MLLISLFRHQRRILSEFAEVGQLEFGLLLQLLLEPAAQLEVAASVQLLPPDTLESFEIKMYQGPRQLCQFCHSIIGFLTGLL